MQEGDHMETGVVSSCAVLIGKRNFAYGEGCAGLRGPRQRA